MSASLQAAATDHLVLSLLVTVITTRSPATVEDYMTLYIYNRATYRQWLRMVHQKQH